MTIASKTKVPERVAPETETPERGGPPRPAARVRYDEDVYGWVMEQGALIRAGRHGEVDRADVAEEIESVGRTEFLEPVSASRPILLRMPRWEHRPNHRGGSWALSIEAHRDQAARGLADDPSLRPRLDEAADRACATVRLEAVRETGLRASTFPEACPSTRDEMLSRPYAFG